MSFAAPSDLPGPTNPVRGRAGRAFSLTRRHAAVGLLLWAGATILPLVVAIQALGAAGSEASARRRETADAYQRGREDTVAGEVGRRRAALAGLDRLEAMSPAELEEVIDTAGAILDAKRPAQPWRRLAAVPADGSAVNRVTARVGAVRRDHG